MPYYFSHDDDASTDPKIVKMRMLHGWEGYGIYWAIIEILRRQPDYTHPLDYDCIAFALGCDAKKIRSIVENFDLFRVTNEKFFSQSLRRRMLKKEKVSAVRKITAEKRWGNHLENIGESDNANAMQTQCKSNANAMQLQSKCNANAMQMQSNSTVKKRKEKERKKKEKETEQVFSEDVNKVFVDLQRSVENRAIVKRPINEQQWKSDIDLAIRKDGITAVLLLKAISIIDNDAFWGQQILSAKNLRKHADRILMKTRAVSDKGQPPVYYRDMGEADK